MVAGAVSWIFAPLGFDTWQATAMSVTGLVAKENVMATAASLLHLTDATETDPSLWSAFAALFPSAGALPRSARSTCCALRALPPMGTHPCPDELRKVGPPSHSGMSAASLGGRLMINQFYLAATGVVGVWTIVAVAFAVAIVFQLVRPMPSYAWDDAGIGCACARRPNPFLVAGL